MNRKLALALMLAFSMNFAVADDCGQPEPVVVVKAVPVAKPKVHKALKKKAVVRKATSAKKIVKKKPKIKPGAVIAPVKPKIACVIKPEVPPFVFIPEPPDVETPIVNIKPELPPMASYPIVETPILIPSPEPIAPASTVPEPSSIALIALGLAAVGYFSKRK